MRRRNTERPTLTADDIEHLKIAAWLLYDDDINSPVIAEALQIATSLPYDEVQPFPAYRAKGGEWLTGSTEQVQKALLALVEQYKVDSNE